MAALHTAKSEWVHLFSLQSVNIIDRTLIQIKKFTYLRFNFYDPDRKNDKLQFIKITRKNNEPAKLSRSHKSRVFRY